MSSKPKVFIGSSVEGLYVAETLQLGLDYFAEVTIWHQGVFGLSQGTLEELVRASRTFDFAILVLTPDDLTIRRDAAMNSPRDNVIFELGLFMGTLGRERTFIVFPRDNRPNLPSDLAGVTFADYGSRSDGNLRAALGPVCTRVKSAIRQRGTAEAGLAGPVTHQKGPLTSQATPPSREVAGPASPPPIGLHRLRDAMLGDGERGLTLEEVAELSGYTLGTVRTYMSTGRQKTLGDAIRADDDAREKALNIVSERRNARSAKSAGRSDAAAQHRRLSGAGVPRSKRAAVHRLRDAMLGDGERGLTLEEVAELSGYTLGTVRTYMSTGRQKTLGDAIRVDDDARENALDIVSERRSAPRTKAAERGDGPAQPRRLRDQMLGDAERGLTVAETARLSGYAESTVRAYLSDERRRIIGDAIRVDEKARERALSIVGKRRGA